MKQISEVIDDLNELIKKGNLLQVVDIASKNLQETNDDAFRKPLALVHSRLEHTDQALLVLQPLIESAPDSELLGLLGGIYKRKWISEQTPELLEKAFYYYRHAFAQKKEYWTGINVATLAKIKKEKNAKAFADEVLEMCWKEYEKLGTRSSFWLLVSIAEALLIKEDITSATGWYKLVTPMAYKTVGQMKTVRRNAKLLVSNLSENDSAQIMNSIYSPRIAVFSGHRIDRAGDPKRFPQKQSEAVKRKLKSILGKLKISIGIASLADGADILFHECILEMGRQIRVILPTQLKDFRKQLKEDDPGGWLERFDRIISAASNIQIVSNSTFKRIPTAVYELATDYMIGYAVSLTKGFDGELLPLVVWDEKESPKRGGTYSAVKVLRNLGYEPEIVSVFPKSYISNRKQISSNKVTDKQLKSSSTRNIFAVFAPPKELLNDDEVSEALGSLTQTISDVAKDLQIGTLITNFLGRMLVVSFESVSDAQVFLFYFKQRQTKTSIFVHVGYRCQFALPFSKKIGSYSKSASQASSVIKGLAAGQIYASIVFKVLVALENKELFSYTYSGLFSSEDGSKMEIFEMRLTN